MDRTAVGSIVIGLGATIAAMVFPTKYKNAPRWAVDVAWWGGNALILIGAIYLVAEHPLNDIGSVIAVSSTWFFDKLVAIQRLPGFWIIVAFVGGIIVHRWGIPFTKQRLLPRISRHPVIPEAMWLSPAKAVETFVNPDLLSRKRKAEKIVANAGGEELNMAEYTLRHAREDVLENLYDQLSSGRLMAKGKMVLGDKISAHESLIGPQHWRLRYAGRDLLDLDTGETINMLARFKNVMIAENAASNGSSLAPIFLFPARAKSPPAPAHQAPEPPDTPETK